MLQFDRVKIVWGSDDMGFKTGTLIGPDDLREFVLPGHKRMAQAAHETGRPYLLHSCGQLGAIMEDLIEDVGRVFYSALPHIWNDPKRISVPSG